MPIMLSRFGHCLIDSSVLIITLLLEEGFCYVLQKGRKTQSNQGTRQVALIAMSTPAGTLPLVQEGSIAKF